MKTKLTIWAFVSVLAACGTNSSSPPTSPSTPATSSFAFLGAIPVPVAQCPDITAQTNAPGQTGSWCRTNWPPDDQGTVYLYSFTEQRGDKSFGRSAFVYKPAVILPGQTYPLLTYLHGGTQSGDELFATLPFAQLADDRSITEAIQWNQNTATCQQDALGPKIFGLGGTSSTGFVATDGSGDSCTPQARTYSRPASALPFFLVYPNGIEDYDGGGASWEDGRNPSPGQYDNPDIDVNQQQRDDLGFINMVIATVKSQQAGLVDATRVYLGGVSNGGIMTTRIMCNVGNASYPQLGGIAAFSVSVASMADNIRSGSNGREQCPSSGTSIAPLAIFVGYDAPTPNSAGAPYFDNCNPYNPSDPLFPNQPACPYATVSGDGTVPYGTAYETGGGTYTVNSPSTGNVIASLDNQNFWRDYFAASGAGTASETGSGRFGYFTQYKHYSYAGSPMIYQVYEVDHGLHLNGGSRNDYAAAARVYDFLFEFKKSGGGAAVSVIGGAYDPGSGTYANLSGDY